MRFSTVFTALAIFVAGVAAQTTNGTAPAANGTTPATNATTPATNTTTPTTNGTSTNGTTKPTTSAKSAAVGALGVGAETLMGLMAVPVAVYFGL